MIRPSKGSSSELRYHHLTLAIRVTNTIPGRLCCCDGDGERDGESVFVELNQYWY